MARPIKPPSIEQRIERIELAIGTAVEWLAQSTQFSKSAADGIDKILRGEIQKPRKFMPKDKEPKEDAS
jgi:hypothetical protein